MRLEDRFHPYCVVEFEKNELITREAYYPEELESQSAGGASTATEPSATRTPNRSRRGINGNGAAAGAIDEEEEEGVDSLPHHHNGIALDRRRIMEGSDSEEEMNGMMDFDEDLERRDSEMLEAELFNRTQLVSLHDNDDSPRRPAPRKKTGPSSGTPGSRPAFILGDSSFSDDDDESDEDAAEIPEPPVPAGQDTYYDGTSYGYDANGMVNGQDADDGATAMEVDPSEGDVRSERTASSPEPLPPGPDPVKRNNSWGFSGRSFFSSMFGITAANGQTPPMARPPPSNSTVASGINPKSQAAQVASAGPLLRTTSAINLPVTANPSSFPYRQNSRDSSGPLHRVGSGFLNGTGPKIGKAAERVNAWTPTAVSGRSNSPSSVSTATEPIGAPSPVPVPAGGAAKPNPYSTMQSGSPMDVNDIPLNEPRVSNPIWKHEATFDVMRTDGDVTISLWDREPALHEEETFLGMLKIRLPSLHGKVHDNWFRLLSRPEEGGQRDEVRGELRVQMSWKPLEVGSRNLRERHVGLALISRKLTTHRQKPSAPANLSCSKWSAKAPLAKSSKFVKKTPTASTP